MNRNESIAEDTDLTMPERACYLPTAISLFAGAGGCSLDFQQAGFDVRFATDIDRQDQRQAQEYRDDLEPKFGRIEILLLGKGRDLTAAVQNDPPRLQVYSYEALISTARTQLDWLPAELKTEEPRTKIAYERTRTQKPHA